MEKKTTYIGVKEIWHLDGFSCAFRYEPGNATSYHISVVDTDGRFFVCVGNHNKGCALSHDCYLYPNVSDNYYGYFCEKFDIPYDLMGDARAIYDAVNVAYQMMLEERNS